MSPNHESNPEYNIINADQLFSNFVGITPNEELRRLRQLFSQYGSIFKSEQYLQVFYYFWKHRAATPWVLQVQLGIPEATIYRIVKDFHALKLIEKALYMKKEQGSKGGPRPIVWILHEASKTDIADAINLHYRSLSPKYRVAEEVAQTILDEYKTGEITYREIIVTVKERRVPYSASDIARLAAQYLSEKGMKVWR